MEEVTKEKNLYHIEQFMRRKEMMEVNKEDKEEVNREEMEEVEDREEMKEVNKKDGRGG